MSRRQGGERAAHWAIRFGPTLRSHLSLALRPMSDDVQAAGPSSDAACPAFVPRANAKRCETISNVEQSKRLVRSRFRPIPQVSGLGVCAQLAHPELVDQHP